MPIPPPLPWSPARSPHSAPMPMNGVGQPPSRTPYPHQHPHLGHAPPAPSGLQHGSSTHAEPMAGHDAAAPVVIRAAGRRRQQGSAIGSVLYAVGLLGLVGGVAFGVVTMLAEKIPDDKPPRPRPVPQAPPLQVADGVGRNPDTAARVTPDTPPQVSPPAVGSAAIADAKQRADVLLQEAVRKITAGVFREADRLAQEAIALVPEDGRAKGVWCLAAYADKYSALADTAIDELDGSCVIDFGGKYGTAGFVERHGDVFEFQCRGRNVPFTLAQLNSMDAVRFRIAARWLDGAGLPQNDLILGSIQYVKHLDETGRYLGPEGPWKAAARGRWQKALGAPNVSVDVRQHAEWLLSLVDR